MTTIAKEREKATKVKRELKNQRYGEPLATIDNLELRIIATVIEPPIVGDKNKKARIKPKIILL